MQEDLVQSLVKQWFNAEYIQRIVAESQKKRKSSKEIAKGAKTKVHQTYGVFVNGTKINKVYERLVQAIKDEDEEEIKKQLTFALQLHVSSGERVNIMDELYKKIFEITWKPKMVLDVACGLNPISLPWMGLDKDIQYDAFDVHDEILEIVRNFTQIIGYTWVHTFNQDLLSYNSDKEYDIAFIFKTLSTVDFQQKGSAAQILEHIHAKYLVISFPIVNIGYYKKWKNMLKYYSETYEPYFADFAEVHKIPFHNELVYVVKR
jgi:16S rRNA (guanine(1405)-N(7))-methyltransferase